MTKEKKEDLKKIADKANKYHEKFKVACCEVIKQNLCAITYAKLCGEALLDAKKMLSHGYWKNWLSQHFPDKSYETAVNYMRIAEEWDSDYMKDWLSKNEMKQVSQNSILQAIRHQKKEIDEVIEDGDEQYKYFHGRLYSSKETEELKNDKEKSYFIKYLRKEICHYFMRDLCRIFDVEELYLIYTDVQGVYSYDIWYTFKDKLQEVLERERVKNTFCDNAKYEFERWKKFSKIRDAKEICPESLSTELTSGVDEDILNKAKADKEKENQRMIDAVMEEVASV